jgi:hypothetical protein
MMSWQEALEIVVGRTRHERYRVLCSDAHPDREHWRARMLALAEAPSYPPLATQAANLAGAAGRVVGAIVRGEPVTVPAAVLEERQSTCAGCPRWDAAARRCRLCGCRTDLKLRLARERCPDRPPRWLEWEGKPDDDAGTG